MKNRISALLRENGIELFGFLPLSDCTIIKPYLLTKAEIHDGSVAVFAMPYYTHSCDGARNISAYAVGRDYHLFFKRLSGQILPALQNEFPRNRFAAFADHSPIEERTAAARAGIGILGCNGLLITEKYSSYIFLGEIITDAALDCESQEPEHCENCGACMRACPFLRGEVTECLSAITQRKGALSENEAEILCKYGSVWGCDLCQEVCPHTAAVKKTETLYSPITFFEKNTVPWLTQKQLSESDDADFSERAYSWRGRAVILRNLAISEKKHETAKENPKAGAGTPEGKRTKKT